MKYKYPIAIATGLTLTVFLFFGQIFGGSTVPTPTECHAIKDGPTLDWEIITSDAELEICLLKLAQDLETPKAMADWLTMQGFDMRPPYNGSGDVMTMVGGFWNLKKHSTFRPFGTWVDRATGRTLIFLVSLLPYPLIPFQLPAHPYRITVSYYKNGHVEVDAGPSIL